jgi:hypothetical protein
MARAPRTWRQWFELAILESWSVRRLSQEIDAEVREAKDSEAEDTTRAALLEAVRHAERMNAEMKSFAALLDRLECSPRPPREVEDLLLRAYEVFRHVARRTGALLARVSELRPEREANAARREN